MSQLSLNKSSLSRQSRSLETYQRFLPSLDLRRQQLMAELGKARRELAASETAIAELRRRVGEQLPMLANHEIELDALVQVRGISIDSENVAGTLLPRLLSVDVDVREYGLLGMPHWVDAVVQALRTMLELQLTHKVQQQRLEQLALAVRKTSQRINLFEKVLIPRAEENIRRIRIFLSDAERAAVVRSKLAKRKRAQGQMA